MSLKMGLENSHREWGCDTLRQTGTVKYGWQSLQ